MKLNVKMFNLCLILLSGGVIFTLTAGILWNPMSIALGAMGAAMLVAAYFAWQQVATTRYIDPLVLAMEPDYGHLAPATVSLEPIKVRKVGNVLYVNFEQHDNNDDNDAPRAA